LRVEDVVTSLKSVLGMRVRELRRAAALTQEGLAEQLGVTPRYLAGIERGERNLTLDSVDALAVQLGVEALSLLEQDAGSHQPR
jgi:transcriptional regulator with XRE-family HTH domain